MFVSSSSELVTIGKVVYCYRKEETGGGEDGREAVWDGGKDVGERKKEKERK